MKMIFLNWIIMLIRIWVCSFIFHWCFRSIWIPFQNNVIGKSLGLWSSSTSPWQPNETKFLSLDKNLINGTYSLCNINKNLWNLQYLPLKLFVPNNFSCISCTFHLIKARGKKQKNQNKKQTPPLFFIITKKNIRY